ncbi:MAG: hypothetical protein KJ561_06920 [Nanoarchaeota archaeon]|nr:hypothetical protein [Nanoarchaeota archaeon]
MAALALAGCASSPSREGIQSPGWRGLIPYVLSGFDKERLNPHPLPQDRDAEYDGATPLAAYDF